MSTTGSRPGLRALIYNRVSADPSGRRVSVESQDVENRAFCEREGWHVVGTIVDNDRSASRFAAREREGYQQVREALTGTRLGRIDVLVCWESSRAQRDLADYVSMRDLCAANHVLLAYKGRVYDLTEGDDRFATGIDALVDEREAERIRDRVQRGHRTSVSQGRPRGVVPYGYTRTYDPVGGHLLSQSPDPETAPIVQEIVARLLAGETLYKIAQDLNSRSVLTPRGMRDRRKGVDSNRAGWSSSMVRNLVSKPSLKGVRTHLGSVVKDAAWEPVVDPGDWARVQALLRSPDRPAAASRAAAHLLSGIAECGVCGGWMRPLMNRGRMTYACAGVNPTASKGHVVRSAQHLDAWVMVMVGTYLASQQLQELLAPRPTRPEQAVATAKLEGLRAQLVEFENEAVAGRISASSFGRIESGLLVQIAALENDMAVAVLPPAVAAVAGPGAEERFPGLPLGERRRVVRAVCRVVVHRSTQRGVRGFDPSTVEIVWSGSS